MKKSERFVKEITIDYFMEKYYDFENIVEKCRACPGYASTWACPEFDFDPSDYWTKYKTYRVIVEKLYLEEATSPQEAQDILYDALPEFNNGILQMERDIPGTKALFAEECTKCKTCARPEGKPCRFPDLMRYSVESLGGRGVEMVEDLFGIKAQWSDGQSIPEFYLMLGGLLIE